MIAKGDGPFLKVSLEGKGVQEGSVRTDLLAGILDGLQLSLYRLALVLTGKSSSRRTGAFPIEIKEACALKLVGIEKGSVTLALDLAAYPGLDDEGLGVRSITTLVEGVSLMEGDKPTVPHEFDLGVLEGLHDMSNALDSDVERIGFELSGPTSKRSASLTRSQKAWLSQTIQRAEKSQKEVSGVLREIDLERKQCQVYPPNARCLKCSYPPELEVDLIRSLDHEITIVGIATSRPGEEGIREFTVREIRSIGDISPPERETLTSRRLLETGLGGMWAGRIDTVDPIEYAEELRRKALRREGQ